MPEPASDDAAARGAPAGRRALVEAIAVWALATSAAALLYRLRVLDGYFHAVVAALFLYLPAVVLRNEQLERYGLVARPLARNLAIVGVAVAVVFPLFLGGFLAWQDLACRIDALRPLAPGGCARALVSARLRLPPDLPQLALAEVLVIALPEEFFFRGYLQERLASWAPLSRRILGAPVWAIAAASALFAVTHLAVQGNPATLAVFFPGLLFGWMRARTGSVLPGTLFHALCNLYMETLLRSFFG